MCMKDKCIAFDLDGTIAPYKESVPCDIAEFINNNLDHVIICTGSTQEHAEWATRRLTNKTVIGMGNHYPSIDLSSIFIYPKSTFIHNLYLQKIRRDLVSKLRDVYGDTVYIGGRSTIDFFPQGVNKGTEIRKHAGDKEIVYFYDCMHDDNYLLSNDYWKEEHTAIRTHYTTIIDDLKKVLNVA